MTKLDAKLLLAFLAVSQLAGWLAFAANPGLTQFFDKDELAEALDGEDKLGRGVDKSDTQKGAPVEDEKLDMFDSFFLDVIPKLVGQPPNDENGTKSEYREYAEKDDTNDDAYQLTGQQIIERSGYQYSSYQALADDGYLTTVTRIINPLADPKQLRQPPILMEHGGTIDPTAYVVSSSIQHHPEKFPRLPRDGPITSWNRSLAFVLANNGFDVWLAETRGANERSRARNATRVSETIFDGRNKEKNMTTAETGVEILGSLDYWAFSQDDIIAHELKSHMDLVLKLTGSRKVHLFTYSLSTPTSLAFLGVRPDYAEKVQGYVAMAPIVSGEGQNRLVKFIMQCICPLVPNKVGELVLTDLLLTQPIRELIVASARNKKIRYSSIKSVITLLVGPSAKYQTNLELNMLGHMLRSLSFKEAKHLCQQVKTNKLQKYDYGPIKNKIIYNSTEPPIYDLSNLHIKDWIIVAADNDILSTPAIVDHLVRIVNPKPAARINIPGYNHLDLIAGFENDKLVNLPVLEYFLRKSEMPEDLEAAGSRALDLKAFFPNIKLPFGHNSHAADSSTESSKNSTESEGKSIPGLKLPNFANLNPIEAVAKATQEISSLVQKIIAKVSRLAARPLEATEAIKY